MSLYLVHEGVGKLVVNDTVLSASDDGVYEFLDIGSKKIVNSAYKHDVPFRKYMQNLDPLSYVFEKSSFGAVLLFPEHRIREKNEFCEKINLYSAEETLLIMLTGVCGINYICKDYAVVGIISSERAYKDREWYGFKLYRSNYIIQSLLEIKKESRDTPINLVVSKKLSEIEPNEMLSFFEARIQGQGIELKRAVYAFYRYFQCVAEGKPFRADSWILTAPSGAGKTELYRTLHDFCEAYDIPIPVVQVDLSQYTEAGFKGEEVKSIPKQILVENRSLNGIGICFLDEADKKCVPSYCGKGTNVNAAIQSNLLTLIEGNRTTYEVDDEMLKFDSNLTMFVFMGAFQEVRKKKVRDNIKTTATKLGFTSAPATDTSDEEVDIYTELTIDDLIEYGMIEELAGRMTQIINFRKISEADMLKLIKCKVKEISKELKIDIDITDKALKELLTISFGDRGIRAPINQIKELTFEKIASVVFEKVGNLIRTIRIEKNMTQKQLADKMNISDKTVSKWENGLGCPDVTLLNELSGILGIETDVLLAGQLNENETNGGNMKRIKFYRCETCGNIITSTGKAEVSCCGRKLDELTPKESDDKHFINVENIEDDYYVTFSHDMTKDHHICFVAYANCDKILFARLYPEQSGEVRFPRLYGGKFFFCCNKHGLWVK